MMKHWTLKYFLLIPSLFLTFLVDGCWSSEAVELVMPAFVRRGGEVRLTCKHALDTGALYAIKWYKGTAEFYRYVPKETPPIQVFPLPGIHVAMSVSDERSVVIRDVPLEMTGSFKCVVSAETTFETFSASSHLTVVVIGDSSPSVELERTEYHPGDSIRAHCHTPPSFPPANVTWYLEDQKIGDRLMKTDIDGEGEESVAKATVSSISFDLPHNFFNSAQDALATSRGSQPKSSDSSFKSINYNLKNNNLIRIKCRATVYTLYDQHAVVPIQLIPRQLAHPHNLFTSGSAGTHNYHVASLLKSFLHYFHVHVSDRKSDSVAGGESVGESELSSLPQPMGVWNSVLFFFFSFLYFLVTH